MVMHEQMEISGYWIGAGVSENCIIGVMWMDGYDGPVIRHVDSCRGIVTGTDYYTQLDLNPHFLEHIADMVAERYEC